MKLLDVVPAKDKIHKYEAIFLQDSGRKKTVKFGAIGMMDFIQYSKTDGDLARDRRRLYLTRHKKTERWDQPMTPGALSRWILWEEPTLTEAVKKYREKFHL